MKNNIPQLPAGEMNNFPTLEQFKDAYVNHVLLLCNGRKSQAAKILGINRRTMYRPSSKKLKVGAL